MQAGPWSLILLEVVADLPPLWHPGNNADGKFYYTYVVHVIGQDQSGKRLERWFPVINYGKGHATGGYSGSVSMEPACANSSAAISRMHKKHIAKVSAGYSPDPYGSRHPQGSVPPPKVRDNIVAFYTGLAAFTSHPAQPPAKGQAVKVTLGDEQLMPAFKKDPKPIESLDSFEEAAALVLSTTDVEVAITRRDDLRRQLEQIHANAARADDAFEIVSGHVRKLLGAE